jgi:hypothetical protein
MTATGTWNWLSTGVVLRWRNSLAPPFVKAMKGNVIGAMLLCFVLGCATSNKEKIVEPPGSERSVSSGLLSEDQALNIGKQYAEEKGWELKRLPSRAVFGIKPGEWQIVFHLKSRGGPYFVYVNDRTKETRHLRGE